MFFLFLLYFISFLEVYLFYDHFAFFGKRFSYKGQKLAPKTIKVHTSLNMKRPQAMKVRPRNSRKKIRRYSHGTKRSATIPASRKDSPLLHKGVVLMYSTMDGINFVY